jgi:NADPH2:quinone reductase
MPHAIRFHETGEPDVLVWEEVDIGEPGPGEARIRHTAIGLNYVDTYVRSGLYPASLPSALGTEAAGVVQAVGPGVTDVAIGDRVAYSGGPQGAYAEERVMPADRLVVLPDGISDQQAAAMMLKGMTAQYLLRQTYKVKEGDTILFHAAGGGVDLIACQWTKALGATVIGTVGSDEKAGEGDHERQDGPGGLRLGRQGHVLRLAGLSCPRGLMVLFGQSSGAVEPVDLGMLAQKGSLYLTRPTLRTYADTRADLLASAHDLFDVVLSGKVKIEVNQVYPLRDAARAHQDLQARKTTGSTVLTV